MNFKARWFIGILSGSINTLILTACSTQATPTVAPLPTANPDLQTQIEDESNISLSSDQSATILSFTGEDTGGDPVPGVRVALQRYPGLESATTQVVFANNIPGHDAEQIDLEVAADSSTVAMTFFFAEGFVHPSYGAQPQSRTVMCDKTNDSTWSCNEM